MWTIVRGSTLMLLAAPLATGMATPPPGRPARAVDAATLARSIDAYAAPLAAAGDLSGQLLVARRGKVIVERSYGFANLELRVPVAPETRFNIASITKPMTLVLTIQQMQEHRVGMRDSIARWLPDFPQGNRITIEQLLRHRSGIRHELVPDSEATRPRTAAEMVEIAQRLPLDFTPGEKSSYSSGGFTVLARILELASGGSYGELIAKRLFGPLGMTHSVNEQGLALIPGRASCYVPGVQGIENAPLQDFSGLVGAGSVWSTARDLHRFVQAVVTGELGESVRRSIAGDGTLEFDGRTSGFSAFADWDTTSGLEVVFTSNVITGAPQALRRAIPRLAAGVTLAPPSRPAPGAPPGPETLARLEGDYRLENGVVLRVRTHDGAVWANEWILQPTRDGGYFSPRDYGMIRPVADPDGRITRLDWEQNGQVYPAPRVADSAPR